ncbi:lipoprotein insertase outer membrane protein LolB [Psychrobacter sp.]|uniref:lipoprotein insertase outer membrane protein LolB n=1 Tax=Psychrobacter sp. TaxID=56811 RepID=UPI0025D31FB6|nr:lipoprotein insertase outer membrane protein LolB [Psychrobacter sp.]
MIFASSAFMFTGCQTTQQMGTAPNVSSDVITAGAPQYPELLQRFNIGGKIGITIPKTDTSNAKSGSAFYVWAQEQDRFAIDLTGALGIGHTVIEYNGNSATLVSEQTGEIKAASPEELLLRATGWQAPISQLRYWISGRPAPSDTNSKVDAQGRLESSQNGDWVASFSYNSNDASIRIPSKITVVRADGYRVIMTISHG